jgi:hypothetical protein
MLLALAYFLIICGACLVLTGCIAGALHRNALHATAKL